MSETVVPSSWKQAEIGELCDLINGRAFKPADWSEKGLPIIRIQNLNNPDAPYNYFNGDLAEKHRIQHADLLFAWSGTPGTSFGAHTWKGGEAALNQHIFKVSFDESKVDKRFLRYAINQTLDELVLGAHGGVGLRHVTKGKFETTKVSFPSLEEQKIIADKLDTLLAHVNNLKTRLDAIPAILKRFRQSVLAAAVSGKLTEKRKDKSTPYSYQSIGIIAEEIRYGTSKKCSSDFGSVPVLRIPNIGVEVVDKTNLKYADFDKKELSKLALKESDLLLVRSNGSLEIVGKLSVISREETNYVFAGYLIRLRLDLSLADAKFVACCLRSPMGRKAIENKAKSTSGVNNINSKELSGIEIPLPCIDEQTEIVRRVDELFAFADQIDKQVENDQARVNKLTQSILAKAFRGELTAEWRAAHPELISGEHSAEALLERIKAEKAALAPQKRASKSKVTV